MTTAPETVAPASQDALLGGRVQLIQPRRGYRAGMDAALLAAACAAKPGERVVEAGCGPGAVLMQVAARCPGALLTGVERDRAAVGLAAENATLNAVADRVRVQAGDVADGFRATGLDRADWALANPPFFDDETALRPPSPERRGAWMADDGLEAWTVFLLGAVREGGRIVIIHRADRLADILALLGTKAGSFAIRPVHAFAEEPAKRALVRAIRTGKAPLRLLPPLVLHDRATGRHTAEAEAILRGESGLGW